MRHVLPLFLIAALAPAEIVDRVAVRVGRSVLTESDVGQAIRLTAFLNGVAPDTSAAARRKAAERLVDQWLIRHEMDVSRYPIPGPEAIEEVLKPVLAERFGGDPARFRAAVAEAGLTEELVRRHLLWQVTALRFLSLRFRPGIQIQDQQIEDYFQQELVPDLRRKDPQKTHTVDEFRDQIEQTLIEERVNQQADLWIKEMREHTVIEFRPEAFR